MNSNSICFEALNYAVEKHADQYNEKSYERYITHPMRVAEAFGDYPVRQAIAFLHDTVEDTDATIEEITEKFGYTIGEAVNALTRRENESYYNYIGRCKKNEDARVVKIYDLVDNMNLTRLPVITSRTAERQMKYAKALSILLDVEN